MNFQNALDTAIYGAIGGTVTNAGTAVFLDAAPDNYPMPYVVWDYINEGDRNDTSHRLKDCAVFIRSYAASAAAAKIIDGQIDDALHEKVLTVSGWVNIQSHRENSHGLVETDSAGKKTWMRGADYRFLNSK